MRWAVLLVMLVGCGDSGGEEPNPTTERTGPGGKADGVNDPGTYEPFSDVRIDRMGHVEVTPLIVVDPDISDLWNRAPAFGLGLSEDDWKTFERALRQGLIRYDHYDSYPLEVFDLRLDGLRNLSEQRDQEIPDPSVLDWFDSLGDPHPLTEVYLTDALYLDLSKPCPAAGGYLEPELAVLNGEEPQTCGGRSPNEDVIDKFATVLINGPVERAVRDDKDDPYPWRGDSVTEPYAPASDTFPYLAKPYKGWDEGLF